ncbi:aspartic peptidase domain-containing protein [Chaetomium strumarium]|uniref:Aspartic peptidase domain-containing protein n=1 Tax=Chaetomium strumarium TaxID=1170767 RepID=A0AAJ0GPJ9_9PEZI|nr:aspartic peptidase domain-containing protein [Chaetomium strumarium]
MPANEIDKPTCICRATPGGTNMTSLSSLVLISIPWLAPASTASPLQGTSNRDAHGPLGALRAAGFRDAVTTHAIPMRRQRLAPSTTHPALHLRANVPARLRNVYDVYYIIDLQVGNQTIPVSVDTGSSDTWLVQEPYECVSFWWDGPGTTPNCGLGSGLQGNLSGGILPDLPPFLRSYVDGTFVRGYYGVEDVAIAGVTAHAQRLAIVNQAYWHGDGLTSGLLGLAYPYLTSLDGAEANQPPYDPVFTTMWKSGAIEPVFSIALSRSGDQGDSSTSTSTSSGSGKKNEEKKSEEEEEEEEEESYLALGGLPPVEVDETTWARTPIHGMKAVPQWGFETDEKGMYIIKPDAFVVEKAGNSTSSGDVIRNTTQIPVLIDVGATLSYLPKAIVNPLYAAFDPPAQYLSSGGLFFAPCNATVPRFGVQIGGSTFYMAPEDLLRQTARDPTGEWCRVGSEMRFAARHKY